jgi:hypothetical protein
VCTCVLACDSFGPVVSLRVVRFAGWRAGEGRSSQRSTSALLDGGQARIGRHSAARPLCWMEGRRGQVVTAQHVRFAGWRAGEGRSSQRSTSALLDGGQARVGRHSAAQQVRRSSLNFILPSSGDRAALSSTASSAGSLKPDADGSTDGVDQHS